MYEATYRTSNLDKWALPHDAGLGILAKPDFKSYEDAEMELVEIFGNYLGEYHPAECRRVRLHCLARKE